MEIFFYLSTFSLLIAIIGLIYVLTTKFESVQISLDSLHGQQSSKFEILFEDIDRIEKIVSKLSQQMDALPDVVKDDHHRFLLDLRANLEATKPIKPNNWDSVKEAFKGPARKELNE